MKFAKVLVNPTFTENNGPNMKIEKHNTERETQKNVMYIFNQITTFHFDEFVSLRDVMAPKKAL